MSKTYTETFLTIDSGNFLSLDELKKILSHYTDSEFESLSWNFNKFFPDKVTKNELTITFYAFKDYPKTLYELKYWLIISLASHTNPSTLSNFLQPFRYLYKNHIYEEDDLLAIEGSHLIKFYESLFVESKNSLQRSLFLWRKFKGFYKDLNQIQTVAKINKFLLKPDPEYVQKENRKIPEDILFLLDEIFMNEDFPLVYKITYWVLRLYPNRITEVLSLPLDCLFQDSDGNYILKIPTFKQAGPYSEPQWRFIYLEDGHIEKYLISLIQKQQKYLRDQNVSTRFLLTDKVYQRTKGIYYIKKNTEFRTYRPGWFNKLLKKIVRYYNIKDSNGNFIHLSSHMFRYNAITDRIIYGEFTPLEVASLTGHLSTAMIEKSYLIEDFDDTQKVLDNLSEEEKLLFEGRVVNISLNKIKQRPYAKTIGNLGVCSDVRACKKNIYQCLCCTNFHPKIESIEFYEQEKLEWEKKLLLARNTNQEDFAEKCSKNIQFIEEYLRRRKNNET